MKLSKAITLLSIASAASSLPRGQGCVSSIVLSTLLVSVDASSLLRGQGDKNDETLNASHNNGLFSEETMISGQDKNKKMPNPSTIVPAPDIFCPVATSYTTKANDNGRKIAKQVYPAQSVDETWGHIVSCNVHLQEFYTKQYPEDKTTVQFDVAEGMELVIPDRQVVLRTPVIGNTTFEELKLKTNGFKNPLPPDEVKKLMANGSKDPLPSSSSSSGGKKNTGERKLVQALGPEGSPQSFGPYPDTNVGDWNHYQCVPMYDNEFGSTVTIFSYRPDIVKVNPLSHFPGQGDTVKVNGCKHMYKVDGCSSPVWSAYENSYRPACNRHDLCYGLANHYDSDEYPKTVSSRLKCDSRFLWDMLAACETWHGRWWHKRSGEYEWCNTNAQVWADVLALAQGSNALGGGLGGDDVQRSSYKQLWRPWDSRLPKTIKWAQGFLVEKGRIRSMSNGLSVRAKRTAGAAVTLSASTDDDISKEMTFVRPPWWEQTLFRLSDFNWCLGVKSAGGSGAKVVSQWCNPNKKHQQWYLDDIQRLHPVHDPNLCLDMGFDINQPFSVSLIVKKCNVKPTQQWFQS